MSTIQLEASDIRAAVALFLHYREDRIDEVLHVLNDSASNDGRLIELVMSLLQVMSEVAAPAYSRSELTEALNQFVLFLASQENANG